MPRKHYTDVIGTLGSGGIATGATTHTFASLTYINGTAVPTLAAGESFLLSILDASGAVLEVVNVTAWNSGTKAATITRAQEGTSDPGTTHAAGLAVVNGVYPSDLGRVLLRDTLSSDFTTTTVGAYVSVTGLSVTFTPPVDGYLLVNSRMRTLHTTAGNYYTQMHVSPAPPVGPTDLGCGYEGMAASTRFTFVLVGIIQVTGGTAYTLQPQVFQSIGSGTFTVESANAETELTALYVPA